MEGNDVPGGFTAVAEVSPSELEICRGSDLTTVGGLELVSSPAANPIKNLRLN